MTKLSRLLLDPCGSTEADRRNQLRILAWMLPWMGAYLLANLAISNGWVSREGWTAVAISLLQVLFGLATLLAYRRFLREADELRRKVELDALALAVGVGVVTGLTLFTLVRTEIGIEADPTWTIVLMMVTYSLGVVAGLRRYA